MQLSELKPQFMLVMGGAGSGKNHFIENDPTYSKYELIDVDAIKGELGVSAAITSIKPMLKASFEVQENVVHPTTGSNLKAQENKIKMAHEYGYVVTLILKDTPVEQAIDQVRNRVKKGGHDVELEKIILTNKIARENFNSLSTLADKSIVVQ